MCDVPQPHGFCRRSKVVLVLLGLVLATLDPFSPARADELALLREDVRSEGDSSYGHSDQPAKESHENTSEEKGLVDGIVDEAMNSLGGLIALSPFWFPKAVTDDRGVVEGYFSRYPYCNGPGYMMLDKSTGPAYRWSARLRSDYAENFDGLSQIGGHLLLSTTSRWGLDMEMNQLQERLSDHARDRLWLGDCNVVYRFAQSERSQWRTGIGLNWLDDPIETNYGFNFTYGFDVYPVKPLVFSTELDWGTLGGAEAFHFRTTAGAVIHGLEAYVGYEYRDIERFQFNGLVAGVRVWF